MAVSLSTSLPSRRWRAAGTICAGVLASTACLPSVHLKDPMPMSIHRDATGALTVSFPVCRGDRVWSVAVGAEGSDGSATLRYGPAPERQRESTVETFVVDEESVSAHRLHVPWPVDLEWPTGAVSTLSEVKDVWASTESTSAGAEVSALLPAGTGDWLVVGNWIEHDAVPVAMPAADANAAVGAFCGGS